MTNTKTIPPLRLSVSQLPLQDPLAIAALTWLRATVAVAANLHTDSRAVLPGDAFLAYAVEGADNRTHIEDAIARGAAAVLMQPMNDGVVPDVGATPLRLVDGLDVLAGSIASGWYQSPSDAMAVIGVTGTNGKTSCTQWLATALAAQGVPTATIGTLGVGMPDKLVSTGFTTPNAAQLQRCLADLRQAGAAAVAMEVSSHALHQGRVNGTAFDIAVFTNLTQDHLDYHGTLEAYERAKARLFDWPGLRLAVINRDDPAGCRLLRHLAGKVPTLSYGIRREAPATPRSLAAPDDVDAPADYRLSASDVRSTPVGGTALTIHADGGALSGISVAIEVATLGEFNVSNVLAVLGALLGVRQLSGEVLDGASFQTAVASLSRLQPVLGRMQKLGGRLQNDEPLVVIDYAHTPDALEKTLGALRPVAQARGGALLAMFGCGGDRDAAKRPLMGAIAERLADAVVLTSDNPRSEIPATIIDQIAVGMKAPSDAQVRRIEDRASAILQSIRSAKREDVILLAGKGHEATQDIMGKKRPFSDQDHAQLALAARATHLKGEAE